MRAGLIAAALVGALYACSGESSEDGPSSGGTTGVAAGSSSAGVAGDPGGGGDAGATGGGAVLGGSSAGGAAGEGAGAGLGGLGGGELSGAGGEPPACEPIEVVECGSSWPERCGTVNDGCEDVECGDTCESDAYCSSAGACEPFADPEECQGTEDGSHTVCVDFKGDDPISPGYERRWCTISPQGDSGCVWDPDVECLRCGEPCDPNPCNATRYCNSENECPGYFPGPVSETPTGDKTVCIDGPLADSSPVEYARFYTADPPNEEAGCTWDTGEACWKCGGAP